MPPPAVSETLDRLYGRLPEVYRRHDERLDWPLLRYLSTVIDQGGELETLLDRMIAGDLGDPDAADEAWLRWLGQQVGVRITPGLSEAEARDAIRYSSSGWRGGTKQAVADAAKSVLTGTRYAKVYDHSTSTADRGAAGVWDVLVITRTTETPDPGAVLDAIVRQSAKPAGVVLHHEAYEASWAAIETDYPTWADLEAAGSWDAIQEAGL